MANIHTYRDPETNAYHATDAGDHDADCDRYGDAGGKPHAFIHPGDAQPELHAHSDIHVYPCVHGDVHAHQCANLDLDAGSHVNSGPHHGAHDDAYRTACRTADRTAQFHAASQPNLDGSSRCHAYLVSDCRHLTPGSTVRPTSRSLLSPAWVIKKVKQSFSRPLRLRGAPERKIGSRKRHLWYNFASIVVLRLSSACPSVPVCGR
jgi:hypothetical protein